MATTLPQVGLPVARLLSLPIFLSIGRSFFSDYKNKYIYITSFAVSQKDMLASFQRATRTKPEDWDISEMSVDEYIKEGQEKTSQGDYSRMRGVLYGASCEKDLKSLYHSQELANEELGLEIEDLDEVVKRVVQEQNEAVRNRSLRDFEEEPTDNTYAGRSLAVPGTLTARLFYHSKPAESFRTAAAIMHRLQNNLLPNSLLPVFLPWLGNYKNFCIHMIPLGSASSIKILT